MEIQETLWEPSEEDLYQRAIRQPLERKVARAVQLLQTFEQSALNLSDDGYYLCFSGGKDSIVLAKLAEMAGVKHTTNYSVTTIDPPELVRFIKRQYPTCKWHRNGGKPLPLMMADNANGPPTRLARWCCEIFKESGGEGTAVLTGVRAEESHRRKGLWREVNRNKKGGGIILCPIVYWTDTDVWRFIRQNDLPYCELYDQGYKRLGCIGCPMKGKAMTEDFGRYPGYERLWKKGFQLYWDKYHGTMQRDGQPRWFDRKGFTCWEDIWDWWCDNGNKDKQGDCQLFQW